MKVVVVVVVVVLKADSDFSSVFIYFSRRVVESDTERKRHKENHTHRFYFK